MFQEYGNETNILDMKSYNGRVNVMEEEDAVL
jgi:hypothetical protein